jgi:putative MATE family efflux protein
MMFSAQDLRRLILPLVVEQVLLVTVGMADTVMVSSVGQEAISAISLVDSINVLLINVFSALGAGGAIVTAQYLGREEDHNASIAAKQLLYVVAAASGLVMVVCLVGNGPILQALFGAAEPEVMAGARLYFFITALSYPFIGIYNGGAAVFRVMGNSKVSMWCSALMNLINIGGNAILIYGFGAGVEGAAIATLLSRMAAALVILWLLCQGHGRVQLHDLLRPEYHPAMVQGILRVGVPGGLENGMFQIGKVLVQGLVASFGTVVIAANAMANNIVMIPHVSGSAIGMAMVTVVGQCVGAGEFGQAKTYMLRLTGLVYGTMGTLEVLLALTAGFWVGLFQLPAETSALTIELVRVFTVFAILFWPASFALPNGLRAAGDVRFTMLVSTVSMWIFRVGFSFFLCGPMVGMGIMGVWVAMYIDWIARCAAFIWRYFSGRWQNRQVI